MSCDFRMTSAFGAVPTPISADELFNLPLTDYFFVVDVRPIDEYATGHVVAVRHLCARM
jgi:rhodanese-related sulfurtransferase